VKKRKVECLKIDRGVQFRRETQAHLNPKKIDTAALGTCWSRPPVIQTAVMTLEGVAECGLMKMSSTTESAVVALAVRWAFTQSRLRASGGIVVACLMRGGG
jgi:hypothetical protein